MVDCIANSDTDKGPEVTLYECPCRECWNLARDAAQVVGARERTYAQWVEELSS